MMKNNLLIFLLIHLINSNPIDQNDCSICEFDEYFNPSNGYGCTRLSDNKTLCTCPDHQASTINQPCRICNREGICGPQTTLCSEKSTIFSSNTNKGYFACFCSSDMYLIGEKCPDETIVDLNRTTTVVIAETTNIINVTTALIDMTNTTTMSLITPIEGNNTTSVKISTTTSQMETECINRSTDFHCDMKLMLIVFLSLVYFVNK